MVWDYLSGLVDAVVGWATGGDDDYQAGGGVTQLPGASPDKPIVVDDRSYIPDPITFVTEKEEGNVYVGGDKNYYLVPTEAEDLFYPEVSSPPPRIVVPDISLVSLTTPKELPTPIGTITPEPPVVAIGIPSPILNDGKILQNKMHLEIEGDFFFKPNQQDLCERGEVENLTYTSSPSNSIIVEFVFPNGEVRYGRILSTQHIRGECLEAEEPTYTIPTPPSLPIPEPDLSNIIEIPKEIPAPSLGDLFVDLTTLEIPQIQLDIPSKNIDPYINPVDDPTNSSSGIGVSLTNKTNLQPVLTPKITVGGINLPTSDSLLNIGGNASFGNPTSPGSQKLR